MTWSSYWKSLVLVFIVLSPIGMGAADGVWTGAQHYRPQLSRVA